MTSTHNFGFLLLHSVFFVEFVYTTTSLSSFLLSRVEWMTFSTDFYVDIFFCRSCYECVTAVTCYCSLVICWVNSFSCHCSYLSIIFLLRLSSHRLFIAQEKISNPFTHISNRKTMPTMKSTFKQLTHCIIQICFLQVLILIF